MILWQDLFSAFALVLVVEGIMPFIRPQSLRGFLTFISQQPDNQIRIMGLGSMVLGVMLLTYIRG